MNRKLIIEHPLRDEAVDLEKINFVEKASKKVHIQEPDIPRESEANLIQNVNRIAIQK
jgi:hypothetical protein